MLPIAPVDGALTRETDEGFVDQRRALQGVVAALAREVAPREPFEIVIDQRPKVIERLRVAIGPGPQLDTLSPSFFKLS